jgi:hypothetical protein
LVEKELRAFSPFLELRLVLLWTGFSAIWNNSCGAAALDGWVSLRAPLTSGKGGLGFRDEKVLVGAGGVTVDFFSIVEGGKVVVFAFGDSGVDSLAYNN